MLVDLTLCGHDGAWSFPGSRAFGAWLQGRPWDGGGGLCVLNTEGGDSHGLLFDAVCRTVRGLHGNGRQLDMRLTDCGGPDGRPMAALLSALELDPELGPFAARDAMRVRLLDRHAVVVLQERAPLPLQEWDRFIEQMDLLKACPTLQLCVIVLDARGTVPAQPACDFSAGKPVHEVLSLAGVGSDAEQWHGYLHQRAAWDAGGSLRRAQQLSQRLSRLPAGDDEHVERVLQEHAREAMAESDAAETLARYIRNPAAGQADGVALRANGLLWQPPGTQGRSVVPWAARALLEHRCPPHQVLALRHALVCAPVAAEILALCLHAEAQIRSELHGTFDMAAPNEDTRKQQQRFIEGRSTTLYPLAHPARPVGSEDVWAFASLGETLTSAVTLPQEKSRTYWRIAQLRNSVAHGHYVCWEHVAQATAAIKRFGLR